MIRPRARRAFAGLVVAWLLMSVGAGVAFGPGVGLLAAGGLLAAYVVALFDVDEPVDPVGGERLRSDLPEPVLRLAAMNDDGEGR